MYDESWIKQIKVRINKGVNNKQKYNDCSTCSIAINKSRAYSIISLAEMIREKIDPSFDSTETKFDKVKLYSQDGIDLKDSDLFFIENFGTLYLDFEGGQFNYKQILHQYKMCDWLGKGRFGVVYKIIEKTTGKAFAMKMIKIEGFFSKANNAEILFKEQKALMQFNHNHVIKLYNGFVIKNKICQIMELCAGGDLQHYLSIQPKQRVSEKEARFLILQIWRGISYWHQKGIVHRNLKPDNIFISEEFGRHSNDCFLNNDLIIDEQELYKEDYEDIVLKIGDFIISGIAIEDESKLKSPSSLMYRAPELLAQSEIISTRALDVWSIGIMLYLMIYGYHPFLNESKQVTSDSILNTTLQFNKKIKITEEWEDLLRGLLEKDPQKRSTIFSIFNHRWVELPNSRLDHGSVKKFDMIKTPKEFSFHYKIPSLHLSSIADDIFFNHSSTNIPDELVEDKVDHSKHWRKKDKKKNYKKNSTKQSNSFCDNLVTVFLQKRGSKRKGSWIFNSIFFRRPK